MFTVEDGGVSTPVKWGKQNLQSDNIILVLDEDNMCVWLWHGKNRSLISRRTALRQAESLKGHGYQNGKSIVGRGLNKIVEIDERKIDRDPETTADNTKFVELLNREVTEVNDFIVFFGAGVPDVPVEKPAPKPVVEQPKPVAPKVEVPPVQPKPVVLEAPKVMVEQPRVEMMPPQPKPVVVPEAPKQVFADEYQEENISAPPPLKVEPPIAQAKTGSEALEQSEMGLVIIAVLSQFKDIWVSRKDDGTISIEQMDGPVCRFNIAEGKVKFAPGAFQDIDPNVKASIQKKFSELVAACGLSK